MKQEDLASVDNFRRWVKNNLSHIYHGKKIPQDHLLICLDYIRDVVNKSGEIDVPFWMQLIRELESDLKSIKEAEK